ncbi:myoferlin isoform X1 [Octopus bimaculoides]|uniref:myoferlin isoform X1 n=1 Tax=Octopus bimaculoides TaxID=37653 RepID=UPI0022E2B79C|nr:myoferlin isoform X1 [Octopus bimaculoides]
MTTLKVTVISADKLPSVETFFKLDPMCYVKFQGTEKKTKEIKDTETPEWNETLEFDLKGVPLAPNDQLVVTVKDYEKIGRNKFVGSVIVPLQNLINAKTQELNVTLKDSQNSPTTGTVRLKLEYIAPPSATPGGGVTGGASGVVVTADDDDDEDEDEGDEEPAAPVKVVDPVTGNVTMVKPPKKKKRRSKRHNLSTKKQDFQIRVKVLEARQLMGSNIQPLARIKVYNQTKQTRVKKSTNSPFWNESFFFNFNISPSELFDELIEFQVFNSRKLRSDSLIGSFKMDIGMVYDEPTHAFIGKWLLLSDPDDTLAGCKGYLKICAIVLGPGDESPMKTLESIKASSQNEAEDIEANLLRPAGVSLRPATFTVRLYRAEDIPKMDSDFIEGVKKVIGFGDDKKEFVDPYFIFSFAGKEVRSKTLYSNDHPEWNQDMSLGLQFPSMCERLKFIIKDWDRVSNDDVISSSFLNTNVISANGENGFLPTFGPCFVNFYGSTREYSDLPDEFDDLNIGKGEGVAYRGRALLELKTVLGELPELALTDIPNDDLLKVQKFMRRRNYKLHAAFLNATMVSCIDAPIEFEVSIGNYGNKLDVSVDPCASTTQPTNAVFDGCYYHFLPWASTKPCTVVDSAWEDISFRLESLNLFLRIIDLLESNLERIRISMRTKLPLPELAQLVISLLKELIEDLKKPLSLPQSGYHMENELDKNIRAFREIELKDITENAERVMNNATDINEALSEIESILERLKGLAIEPQNSMPDVIIWMISGEKRIAYFRIPAYELLYSENPNYIGRQCGKVQSIQLKYPGLKAQKEKYNIPALIRVKLWLGLAKQEKEWHNIQTEGELAVFAETYENQVSILGSWTDKSPTMTRPKFSDIQGKLNLKKEYFTPPNGWQWDGDWYISQELSLMFDKDAGHRNYLEEVYENQYRLPRGTWGPMKQAWSDVKGDVMPSKDETKLPEGWKWDDDWKIDLSRAVDEEGFEYCVEATMGGYGPVQKNYHLCRRRRWVRSRTLVVDEKAKLKKEKLQKQAAEGWEFAPLFSMKFHAKERKMDLVRRRRWHRKMISKGIGGACFFRVAEDDSDKEVAMISPRMFLTFGEPQIYQLRAYLYQARDLAAADDSGLSDPFARVSFLKQSMVTEAFKKSLCPTWDQTLIFEQLEIYGNPQNLEIQPPDIFMEIFDHDMFGKPEFLGRSKASPMVKLDPADARNPVLQWYPVYKNDVVKGEILAAFELFLITPGKDLPFLPPKRGELYQVPNGIRPVLQRTGIEFLVWGVRNMKRFQLLEVNSPSIEFEIGGNTVSSTVIKNTKKNPNFNEPSLFLSVMLPKEEHYMPPLNIRVKDHRQFGRKPTVGVYTIKSLENFRHVAIEPPPEQSTTGETPGNGPPAEMAIDMPPDEMPQGKKSKLSKFEQIFVQAKSAFPHIKLKNRSEGSEAGGYFNKVMSFPQMDLPSFSFKSEKEEEEKTDLLDLEIDWWSKYYASIGDSGKCKKYLEKGYDKLVVYNDELENCENFAAFSDFCHSFTMLRGKDTEDAESNTIGELKCSFKVYPLPADPSEPMPDKVIQGLPPSDPHMCIVRVYVVKGIDLQPNDPSGLADPYVKIKLGKHKVDSKSEYIPNTINPCFGKMFELKTVIPLHKDLTIGVYDRDLLSSDDLIGETTIDLENRFLTKFRATCGLPKSYCISGVNKWRDSVTPKELLTSYCERNVLGVPMFYGSNSVKVGNVVYNLTDFEPAVITDDNLGPAQERLALHVLNKFPLIKEHIETRSLYNPLQPGIEQGQLQMWVDLFPESLGPPGDPFNIASRKPLKYKLRCIIWNTVDVVLDEESITGEKMSDIYVVGWMDGINEKQETDVHYRSLNGEGNFNWRFVFPFDYLPAEQNMVVKKKEHFWSLDETELNIAPNFMLQIWDNDTFSSDDFLGVLELNLNSMPTPSKKASQCNLKQIPSAGGPPVKTFSLFEQRRIRGFWPCYSEDKEGRQLTGKLEMELELVTEDEAIQRPAGTGREDPNENPHLEPPNRPDTSFMWFTSPWKTFKYIFWRNYKWKLLFALIIIIVILLIVLFVYSFPGAIVQRIIGSLEF